jgi:hypothetical protein
MSDERQPKHLTAIHTDPDTGTQTVLGELQFGADSKLTLTAANAGYEKYLDEFVQRLNAKDVLNVKVGGGKKFALGAEQYYRSDPNFFEGLRKYVQYYDCIHLAADDDQLLHPEEFEDLKL